MVLFLMYALIIRGPTVRLARQGARLGKTVATANRVVKVLYREPTGASADIHDNDDNDDNDHDDHDDDGDGDDGDVPAVHPLPATGSP